MFKHANQYMPDQKVIEAHTNKTAGAPRRGKVVNADPESNRVKVSWDQGGADWVNAEDLKNV
jgi:hypothetical protein